MSFYIPESESISCSCLPLYHPLLCCPPPGLLLLASPLPSVEDNQSSIATTTPNEPLKKPFLLSYIYSTSFNTRAQSLETSVCSSSRSVQDNTPLSNLTLW